MGCAGLGRTLHLRYDMPGAPGYRDRIQRAQSKHAEVRLALYQEAMGNARAGVNLPLADSWRA